MLVYNNNNNKVMRTHLEFGYIIQTPTLQNEATLFILLIECYGFRMLFISQSRNDFITGMYLEYEVHIQYHLGILVGTATTLGIITLIWSKR